MEPWSAGFVFFCIVALAGTSIIWYYTGRFVGKLNERHRVSGLCWQVFLNSRRATGEIRWVWNAVEHDRDQLLPEHVFFGSQLQSDGEERTIH